MQRLLGLGLAALLVGGLAADEARAQDDYSMSVADRNLVTDVRNGRRTLKEIGGPDIVDKAARYAVLRIKLDVNRGRTVGTPTPMTTLVTEATAFVVDTSAPSNKNLKESQREYIQAFGKAACTHLRELFAFNADRPKYEDLVRVNGGRILAELARSGYEGCADVAIDVVQNPKESDGVRLYAFRALRNLFAAVNPDDAQKSNVKTPALEKKAVDTLIAAITFKPKFAADAGDEEKEAYHYVRREAVRALGFVRKPVLREGKTVVANPAMWLLRVANMDPAITPVPSISERVEGLLGYLQLSQDREQNMDYAIFFIGRGFYDLAYEYKTYTLSNQAGVGNPMPMPGAVLAPRDYQPWRVHGNRLLAALTDWKAAWELENPAAQAPMVKMVTELVDQVTKRILDQMTSGDLNTQRAVDYELLGNWLQNQQYPSKLLFKDDPTSTITLPQRMP